MTATYTRALRSANQAERKAADRLDAARTRLDNLLRQAHTEGATVRELAEITGRPKTNVHRVISQ